MANIAAKTTATATAVGLDETVIAWLSAEGVFDYESVALMAASEGAVQSAMIEPAVAKNVECLKTIKGKITLTKFWVACRKLYETDRAPEPPISALDAPIPQVEDADLKTRWANKHGFVLPDAFLLIDTVQGKMWRDANAMPARVSVWLAESLRPRSCVDKTVGHQLSIVPGKVAEAVAVVADDVAVPFELFVRARAFFMTLSYVALPKGDWFPYQSAVAASEQVLGHIMATYNGRTPPVKFLSQAWAATIHQLSEQVRVSGRSPREILDNTGSWEHRWKWAPGASSEAGSGNSPAHIAMPDVNSDLKAQLDKMKTQVQSMQSQRDAANNRAIKREREGNNRNDRDREQFAGAHPKSKAQGKGFRSKRVR